MKESEKKDKNLDLARELEKLWNMKVTVIPIITGTLGTVTKGLVQGLGDLEIRRCWETIQTTVLLKSAQNTEESPGDLRRFAVTQIPVENYQLSPVTKTRTGVAIIKLLQFEKQVNLIREESTNNLKNDKR